MPSTGTPFPKPSQWAGGLAAAGLRELLAYFAHVLFDDAGIPLAVDTPYRRVNALAVENLVGVGCQEIQDVELALREGYFPIPGEHLPLGPIDEKALCGHHFRCLASPGLPAQVRLDARRQLSQAEGLRDVVVPADCKAVNLVLLGDTRCKKQNGAAYVVPDGLAQLQPVCPRHADVQQDKVGLQAQLRQGLFCVVGLANQISARPAGR